MYIYMTILSYSDSYHKVYLRITYMALHLIYYMHIRKREREKGRQKCSTMEIRCEINTVNGFCLPFHHILVCQSRKVMGLTTHHFQDVFNNHH